MKIEIGSDRKATLKAVILKKNMRKDSALDKLMNEASRCSEVLSISEIRRLVEDRENIATTLVSDNIAFPHAVKQGIDESTIIIGVSPQQILWSQPNQYVRLIVLFAGGNKQHLRSMAAMAKLLRNPVILKEILNIRNQTELINIVQKNLLSDNNQSEIESRKEGNIALLKAAVLLQSELKNSSLAVIDDVFSSNALAISWYAHFDGYILTSQKKKLPVTNNKLQKIFIPNTEIVFVENELKRLTMEKYFKDIDSLIIMYGESTSNALTSIRIANLKSRDEIKFIEDIPYNVSQRVLQLAREIGSEGREGKPVGCLFVIGSEEILHGFTHQLIVNPFTGYPEEERNIIDPSLEETIKEFSKIDGAFIIKPDGTVVSVYAKGRRIL